eukprot:TRINITY_DN10258_c0_g1_i1.p1 TRINITY_DN10258_c0_g1~~TRINITY_DN10258_c0_g1_i1.p1  ORF type:complete len:781 (+),score=240.20 TRINITY_DN10258_c0_g1_i1:182-2524(+)
MKRRFREGRGGFDDTGDDDVFDRPRRRGTGFTDMELEQSFSHRSGGSPPRGDADMMDEETVRRMMAAERRRARGGGFSDAREAPKEPSQVFEAPAPKEPKQRRSSTEPVQVFEEPEPRKRRGFREEAKVFEEPEPSSRRASATVDVDSTPSSRPSSFGPPPDAPPPAAEARAQLKPGDGVLIKNLKAAAYLNGKHGRLGVFDPSSGRWEVTVLEVQEIKAIKPENLDFCADVEFITTEDPSAFVPPKSPDRDDDPTAFVAPKSPPLAAQADPRGGDLFGLPSASALAGSGPAAASGSLRTGNSASSSSKPRTTRKQGTVRWYNGRRKCGMIIPDSGSTDLFIPAQGALNGSQVPPQPGGLFHGTRVSFMPVELKPSDKDGAAKPAGKQMVCMDVRPLPGQIGLSCGVDTHAGAKEKNDDRVAACDLHELGFLAAVFDGHRGSACSEYVAKELPKNIHANYRARVKREPGASVLKLSSEKEAQLIAGAFVDAFEAVDKAYMVAARKKDVHDGSTGLCCLVSHGFEAQLNQGPVGAEGLWAKVAKKGEENAPPEKQPGTCLNAPGGVAKLFLAWAGDSRCVLIRGRTGLRCSEDHKPGRKDEQARIKKAGGVVGQDGRGVWRVGPRAESKFAKELQKGKKDESKMRWFLATSRSFGDATLKAPDPIVIATPEIKVVDLTPEDWAVVVMTDGVTEALTDQQVANVVLKVTSEGKDAVAASKAIVQAALKAGGRDNATAIVMRLGWASPPSSDAHLQTSSSGGGIYDSLPDASKSSADDMNMFG